MTTSVALPRYSRYGDSTTTAAKANPTLNNYSQDYTGDYTQGYTGGYTQDYSGGGYTQDYSGGGYTQDYTGGYSQDYTGGYTQDYTGGYAQDYTADNYYADPSSGTEYNNNYSTYDTYDRQNPSFQYNAETGGQNIYGNYDGQTNNSTYLDNYPEYDFATDGNSYNSYARQTDSLRQEGDDFAGETETKGSYPTYDNYGASRPKWLITKSEVIGLDASIQYKTFTEIVQTIEHHQKAFLFKQERIEPCIKGYDSLCPKIYGQEIFLPLEGLGENAETEGGTRRLER
ncbi:uncharacterized protein [Penaeus vannamei]|uniref:uncharacterized protein n=1 Tax=Penaeus vannamei TaxID=6689 RepID=UPI00387F81D8